MADDDYDGEGSGLVVLHISDTLVRIVMSYWTGNSIDPFVFLRSESWFLLLFGDSVVIRCTFFLFPGLDDTKSRTVVARNIHNMIDSPHYKWTIEDQSQSTSFFRLVTAGTTISLVTLVIALLACVVWLWRG